MIFENMFKRFWVSFVLLTFCGLVLCGCTERTAETDTPLLSEDLEPSFQLIGDPKGSLIPPEEVPVVSVEITRQDAENVWWQLTADLAPQYEDLVVYVYQTIPNPNRDFLPKRFLVVIPKNKTHSLEFQSLRYSEAWIWRGRSNSYDFRSIRSQSGAFIGYEWFIFVPEEDVGDYWVLNKDKDEYIPVQQGEKVWNVERERWEWIFPYDDLDSGYPRYWHFYVPKSLITVASARSMIERVADLVKYLDINSDNFTYSMDVLRTDDGYVIPHSFHFTYYHVGDEAIIPNIEEESPKPDAPPARH